MRKSHVLFTALFFSLILSGCGRVDGNVEAASPDPNASQPPFSGSKLAKVFGIKPAPITIPAGTPLGIRLQNSVSSASANSGDRFDAVIDEPVVINGTTVIPQGATATGRVVTAKSSGRLHKPGYLRLALASVTVNGKDVPVQTSSVFAQGA